MLIDPKKQVYSGGVLNWIKKNNQSLDLLARKIQYTYIRTPATEMVAAGEESKEFFKVNFAKNVFWAKANHINGKLMVMLPNEFNELF